jgi:hypothetical protein
MASRSNPNVPTKAKRLSHPRKAKKNSRKIVKPHGSKPKSKSKNIHVGGEVSNKKARKLEKKQNFAKQRALEKAMEEAGEVRMTGMSPYSSLSLSLLPHSIFCKIELTDT